MDLLLILILISPVLPVIVSWLYVKGKRKAALIIIPVVFMQAVIGTCLVYFFGDVNVPLAGFAILIGILVILAILGPVLYSIFYFCISQPERWKFKLKVAISIYSVIGLVGTSPILIPKLESYLGFGIMHDENFNFYGKLTDSNGVPLRNSLVNSSNCEWLNKKSLSNEDGLFNIRGHCSGLAIIDDITNSNGEECIIINKNDEISLRGYRYISIDNNDDYFSLSSFDSSRTFELVNWKDHSALSPVTFVCK